MRFWTLLKLLFVIALLLVAGILVNMNQGLLLQNFKLFAGKTTPLYMVVLVAFVVGLLVSVIILGIQEVEIFIENFKRKRRKKKAQSLETKYVEGVEAILDGRRNKAKEIFEEILEEDPDHTRAAIKLGQVYRKQGKINEALEVHKKAQNKNPEDTGLKYELANDYKQLNKTKEARETLEELVHNTSRKSPNALICLRDILVEEEKWEDALDVQKKLLNVLSGKPGETKERENELGLRYKKAKAHRKEGYFGKAKKVFSKIIEEDSLFLPAHLEYGETLLESGEEEKALDIWIEGVRQTNSPVLMTRIEDFYLAQENPAKAIDTFKEIISETDKDTIPRFLLGKLYLRLEMLDDAREQFNYVENKVESSPTLTYFMSKISERRGSFEEAAAGFKKVIRELGILDLQYICYSCGQKYSEWVDHCLNCELWNSVELDLQENIDPSEFGLPSRPDYGKA